MNEQEIATGELVGYVASKPVHPCEEARTLALMSGGRFQSNTDREYNQVPQVEVQWTRTPNYTSPGNPPRLISEARRAAYPTQRVTRSSQSTLNKAGDIINKIIDEEFRHPGKLFLMRGSNDDDDDEVHQRSVAAEQIEPTDQVSIRAPSGVPHDAAEEYLVRSEVGSQDDDSRDRGYTSRARASEFNIHRVGQAAITAVRPEAESRWQSAT